MTRIPTMRKLHRSMSTLFYLVSYAVSVTAQQPSHFFRTFPENRFGLQITHADTLQFYASADAETFRKRFASSSTTSPSTTANTVSSSSSISTSTTSWEPIEFFASSNGKPSEDSSATTPSKPNINKRRALLVIALGKFASNRGNYTELAVAYPACEDARRTKLSSCDSFASCGPKLPDCVYTYMWRGFVSSSSSSSPSISLAGSSPSSGTKAHQEAALSSSTPTSKHEVLDVHSHARSVWGLDKRNAKVGKFDLILDRAEREDVSFNFQDETGKLLFKGRVAVKPKAGSDHIDLEATERARAALSGGAEFDNVGESASSSSGGQEAGQQSDDTTGGTNSKRKHEILPVVSPKGSRFLQIVSTAKMPIEELHFVENLEAGSLFEGMDLRVEKAVLYRDMEMQLLPPWNWNPFEEARSGGGDGLLVTGASNGEVSRGGSSTHGSDSRSGPGVGAQIRPVGANSVGDADIRPFRLPDPHADHQQDQRSTFRPTPDEAERESATTKNPTSTSTSGRTRQKPPSTSPETKALLYADLEEDDGEDYEASVSQHNIIGKEYMPSPEPQRILRDHRGPQQRLRQVDAVEQVEQQNDAPTPPPPSPPPHQDKVKEPKTVEVSLDDNASAPLELLFGMAGGVNEPSDKPFPGTNGSGKGAKSRAASLLMMDELAREEAELQARMMGGIGDARGIGSPGAEGGGGHSGGGSSRGISTRKTDVRRGRGSLEKSRQARLTSSDLASDTGFGVGGIPVDGDSSNEDNDVSRGRTIDELHKTQHTHQDRHDTENLDSTAPPPPPPPPSQEQHSGISAFPPPIPHSEFAESRAREKILQEGLLNDDGEEDL
ncbi:unnamed protein product [Amoebophrya sp. A25]|nr:unnamed protein product [Amoebophrya sp. A25]|eukprot:GSA25T00017147001.1